MAEKVTTIRERRQLTLPREVCEQLGLSIGDRMELAVEDGVLVARPVRRRALDALKEIQEAFASSGLSERELQAAGRRVRLQIAAERYERKR